MCGQKVSNYWHFHMSTSSDKGHLLLTLSSAYTHIEYRSTRATKRYLDTLMTLFLGRILQCNIITKAIWMGFT